MPPHGVGFRSALAADSFLGRMRIRAPLCDNPSMAKPTTKKSPSGIKLGSLVIDRITGFKGVAISRTEFAYGCVHICVQGQQLTKDGDPIPIQTFDDQRIEVLAPPTKSWPEANKSAIKLGDLVRDTITGATGTATARTVALDGRIKVIIEPLGLAESGEPMSALLVIADRLEVIDRSKLRVSETSVATSGGPMARNPRVV